MSRHPPGARSATARLVAALGRSRRTIASAATVTARPVRALGRPRRTIASAAATAQMVAALTIYTTRIVPRARAEIARWESRAQRIADPELRGLALSTLAGERLNAEAAAVFVLLAPRRARPQLIDLLVAWQLTYDYLDTLTERATDDPLATSLRLHRALVDSFAEAGADGAGGPGNADPLDAGDGGYLADLVDSCRQRFWALPAADAVAAVAVREAARCGVAQSHTHAAMLGGEVGELRAWALAERRGARLEWWETAAAGISSLAVHALLAAAADPATTTADAERIASAYSDICALSTLLDSLVDIDADNRSGNLSYVALYPTSEGTAEGMARLAARSAAGASRLPRARVHRVIVAGLAGFYLSDEGARVSPAARAAADAVIAQLTPAVRPALALLRIRRALAG